MIVVCVPANPVLTNAAAADGKVEAWRAKQKEAKIWIPVRLQGFAQVPSGSRDRDRLPLVLRGPCKCVADVAQRGRAPDSRAFRRWRLSRHNAGLERPPAGEAPNRVGGPFFIAADGSEIRAVEQAIEGSNKVTMI